MALITCSECGKKISDQATTCPECGAPTEAAKKDKRKKRGNVQGAGCLLILLALIIGAVFNPILAGFLGIIGLAILIIGFFV